MSAIASTRIDTALVMCALLGLAGGIALHATGHPDAAQIAWMAGVAPVLLSLLVEIVASLRRREFGLDIVAALSMSAALAFGETLAAAVVALMYSGGTFLESYAEGRARREMRSLLSRVPRTATLYENGALKEVPLDRIVPGDRLLIRQGDIAPVDGVVASAFAMMDQSALTGEPMPVRLARGDTVMSGSTNAGDACDLQALRPAAESTYAGIVRLVEAAQKSKAPMARLADRYSLAFLVLTMVIATSAWWFTGDPIRAVAVLVIATPCPLILAVPVALVAGLSRAARFGVLVKGASSLEALASIRVVILDKTGTLTEGRPRIVAVETFGAMSEDDAIAMAAALEQASKHPVAQALVSEARMRNLDLTLPADVVETPGEGLCGVVAGRAVVVGGPAFVSARVEAAPTLAQAEAGSVTVLLGVDGRLGARIVMLDRIREGVAEMLARLRRHGIGRMVLATGDSIEVALTVTAGLGFDAVHAGLSPEQKVELVRNERKHGPVMMVGDGVNDAPALAIADVGVAMGARGAAASSEAADVVILVDDVSRALSGVEIGRASRAIAMQSVIAGIGLSTAGMVAAAFGLVTPVQGAIAQEAIDVAVILNALRVLQVSPSSR